VVHSPLRHQTPWIPNPESKCAQEGDTVVVGELELEWSADRSEARLFETWEAERKAAGKVAFGAARWPHAGG
jgi:hypothetical protein